MQNILQRDPSNKVLGGVCGGMGNYFRLDPILFRAIFLLMVFAGGSGFLLYLILWLILPEGQNETFGTTGFREPVNMETSGTSEGETNNFMGLLLLSAGILLLVNNLIPEFNFRKFWPLILIVVGGGLILGKGKVTNREKESGDSENNPS